MEEDLSLYNPEGSTLRKAQLRMLDILVAVDKVAKNNNIDYWLDFGTLLGAVRHQGFIPWDDDMDVCVLDTDYDRFREALIRELPAQFALQDSSTDPYAFFPYGRVRDKKSYCYYPMFTKLKEQGLCVDIFRLSEIGSYKMKKLADWCYRRTYHEIHHYGDVAYSSRLKIVVNRILAYCLHPFSLLLKWFVTFSAKFSSKGMLAGYAAVDKLHYKKNIFPLTTLTFEGHIFPVPGNYDAYLHILYGDYMKIPAKENRKQVFDMDKVKFFD